jgi:hypothetical protein
MAETATKDTTADGDKTKARTSTADAQPLEGSATLDDKMTFEPTRLSYRGAVAAAAEIARVTCEAMAQDREIVITGGELLTDLANLTATELMLAQSEKQYTAIAALADKLLPEELEPSSVVFALPPGGGTAAIKGAVAAFAAGIPPVVAGLQAGIGLLALFRENVEFTGTAVTLDQLAVQFAVAAALKTHAKPVVRVYETAILPALDSEHSALQKALDRVQDARGKAWSAAAPHVKSLIDAQVKLEAAAGVPNNKEAVKEAADRVTELRQQLAPITDALDDADKQFAGLTAQLEKVDEATGLLTLGRLLRAERMKRDAPLYLHVRVVASGGHHRVARNLFRMLFAGDGVSALGGAVVRWGLLDSEGALLAGGVYDYRRAAEFPRRWFWRSPVYERD